MKKIITILIILFFTFSLFSQIKQVVLNKVTYPINKPAVACTVSLSVIPATNSTTCDEIIVFDFSGCSNYPYDIIINSPLGCLPGGINGITTPSYSLTGLCTCYELIDINVFDQSGFVCSYSAYNNPQSPTFVRNIENENHIVISPNPSSDILSIKSKINFNRVVLKSVNGIVVKEIEKDVNELTMDLDNLSNGLYFVEVYNSKKLLNAKKVVLQK